MLFSSSGELTPKDIHRTIYASVLGAALIGGCATLSFPFLSIYLYELGATDANISFWLAIASSSTFMAGAFIMPVWGALADKYGRKIIILRSAASLCIAYLIQAFVMTPLELVIGRTLQGLSFGFIPITLALLTEISGPHASTATGLLLSGRSAGTVLGPFIGGLLAHFINIRAIFIVASVLEIFAFIIVIKFVKEPPHHMKEAAKDAKAPGLLDSFRRLSHNRKFLSLLALMIVNQAALLLINPIISLHVMHLTGSMDNAAMLSGIMLGAAGFASVIGGTFWGRFSERHGPIEAMVITFTGDALFSFLQYLAPNTITFGLSLFCFGFFVIGGATSITGAIPSIIDDDNMGSAYGLNATAMNIGNFTGPLLGGLIGSLFSIDSVFLFSATIQGICAILIYHYFRGHRRQPVA